MSSPGLHACLLSPHPGVQTHCDRADCARVTSRVPLGFRTAVGTAPGRDVGGNPPRPQSPFSLLGIPQQPLTLKEESQLPWGQWAWGLAGERPNGLSAWGRCGGRCPHALTGSFWCFLPNHSHPGLREAQTEPCRLPPRSSQADVRLRSGRTRAVSLGRCRSHTRSRSLRKCWKIETNQD